MSSGNSITFNELKASHLADNALLANLLVILQAKGVLNQDDTQALMNAATEARDKELERQAELSRRLSAIAPKLPSFFP